MGDICINIHIQCTFADTSVCFCYACHLPIHHIKESTKGGGRRPSPLYGGWGGVKHSKNTQTYQQLSSSQSLNGSQAKSSECEVWHRHLLKSVCAPEHPPSAALCYIFQNSTGIAYHPNHPILIQKPDIVALAAIVAMGHAAWANCWHRLPRTENRGSIRKYL